MTLKQKRAAELVESGRTYSDVMIAAGYSPNTAKAPTKLTQSKGWQELLNQKITDKKLFDKLDEGLEATKPFSSHSEPDREIEDFGVRHKYLETALKIKKYLNTDPGNTPQGDIKVVVIRG